MHRRARHLKWRAADDCKMCLDTRRLHLFGHSDGAVVNYWPDQSGNENWCDTYVSGAIPVFRSRAQGGADAIEFDGVNDRYFGSTAINWNGMSVTCMFVAKFDTSTSYLFWDTANRTVDDAFHFGNQAGPSFLGNGWNSFAPCARSFQSFTGQWYVSSGVLSANSQVYANGVVPSSPELLNGTLSQASSAYWQIGYEGYWWFDGMVGLIAIFSKELTSPLRRRYEQSCAMGFKIAYS